MAPPVTLPKLDKDTGQGNTFELHLDLGSVQGESQSTLHKDEVELDSMRLGATSPAIRTASGSTKGGKPTVSEITVTKKVDKATPLILNALTTSTVFKTAKITLSKSTGGSKPEDYVIITLTNVVITSYHGDSAGNIPGKGSETVTLNFQKINYDYKMQLVSGLLAGASSWSYDLTSGQ